MPGPPPDPTGYASLLDLFDASVTRHAERESVAVVGDDGRTVGWTGAELARRAALVAWRLRALGLQPGDRILTWCPSSPSLVAVYVGAIRAGVVLVPLDLHMAPDVIERIAAQTGARWLAIGTGRDAPDPREVRLGQIELRSVEALAAPPAETQAAATGAAGAQPDVVFPPDWEASLAAWPRPERATLLQVMYTSGTTGSPKGAMLSQGNILATIEAADQVIPRQQHRLVSVLPLSHLFGQLELFYALHVGAPLLYVRSRNPRVIFEGIRAHRVTTMVVVPQVLDLFWSAISREVDRQGRRAAFDRLRRIARHLPYPLRRRLFRAVHAQLGGGLNLFISAAAFLPPALQQSWQDLGVVVMQGYGATECGFAVAQTAREHALGTVGKPMPPVRVRLDAATGEVQVAGPTVFQGYWANPEATASALDADGWYHTGDLGHWDNRGNLILSGRINDLIALPNGLKVYPEDVENALRVAGLRDTVVLETAPGRIEAVVLPPDEPSLEQARTGTPALPPSAEAAAALRARIDAAVRASNASLGIHQRVVGWRLWPAADFPRTHTLKVRRDVVRAWVATEPRGGQNGAGAAPAAGADATSSPAAADPPRRSPRRRGGRRRGRSIEPPTTR